ncbi:3-hydroxybutyryl-CoA dehydrogenase [Ferrithrix thermotolerans DSM 19514]|jgi:3-hydroxybutyryl-CoA dehydrogenase|uniref:3-hydroxybutyryl-CoA dehydrogenase n=1 Tax=Ferrithrix thermotolerans DSM 19514 TaxID=1121881 RepID=A0A1M4TDK9_9ACTN|nr:3-hydroxyacyl-CoA dehydrogenase family protein [Ferrithrix thermotolerans]SHE42465.1 3-hydroxybutyryl-CoA dehydrogenase [Ferrithrix thermotolerans DSM 19514]
MVIRRVGVVGSGIMGAGIAEVALLNGYEVTLRSRQTISANAMRETISRSFKKLVTKGSITETGAEEALSRLATTTEMGDLAEVDLIVESVVEDLETKKELFQRLDSLCKPETIFTSNTSTLPIVELACATKRAEQVCGLHFFNPAPKMKLVEVVAPITASTKTLDVASEFAISLGKEPVRVKDEAGFVVNALLFPYLNSAVYLLERRVASMEEIDRSMQLGCGFPMGPFQLLDLVGLDTSLSILEALHKESRSPATVPAPTLRRLVAAGRLGKKTQRGFYDYN